MAACKTYKPQQFLPGEGRKHDSLWFETMHNANDISFT